MLEIQVMTEPLEDKYKQQREEIFEATKKGIDSVCHGKQVNVRALLEGMAALQISIVMKAGNVSQEKAFSTVMSAIATFHAHNITKEIKNEIH